MTSTTQPNAPSALRTMDDHELEAAYRRAQNNLDMATDPRQRQRFEDDCAALYSELRLRWPQGAHEGDL